MNSFSPTANGLRVAFRRPAITLAEIAWRWSFVVAGWILGLLFVLEYLDSLQVHRVDRLLLRTNQPVLVEHAIRRIFQGSAFRFTEGGILLLIGLAIAWVVLGSLGRVATASAVLEEFGIPQPMPRKFAGVFTLNFLRVTAALCAVAAAIAALLISNWLWASTHISAGAASSLFFLIVSLIWMAWVVVNWVLSVAAINVIANQKRTLSAIAATLRLCQQRFGPIAVTGFTFGFAHMAAFLAASAVGFSLLAALSSVSPQLALMVQLVLVFLYCAVADFLYTARMAAYVSIIRADDIPSLAARIPTPLTPPATLRVSIDRDELILSDVPFPAS